MKRFWIVVIPFFFVIPSAYAASDAAVSYSKGVVSYSDKDYKKALDLFQEAYDLEPNNPDPLYYLALTHFQLGHYEKSSKYFKILLDQNPNYTPAYFDYGLSLHRQKKYQESLEWFQKAKLADKTKPLPLFYEGLSHYFLGKEDEALSQWKDVEQFYPNSDVADAAKQWIAQAESGKKIVVGKPKKWTLSAAGSAFYDSNVTLDPDDLNLTNFGSEQADVMESGSLNINYRLHHTTNSDFFILYSGYQSAYDNVHFDMDRFNYGRNVGGINFQYKLSENVQMRIPADYTFVTLGKGKYSGTGSGTTAFDFSWGEDWLTSAYAAAHWDEFFQAAISAPQRRDALRASVGGEQYFFFPTNRSRFLKVGYEFTNNDAKGNDWDYYQQRVTFAFNSPLIWKLNVTLLNDIIPLRKFINRDSIFAVKRGDFVYIASGVVSREILPHLTVSGSYTYSMVDSNIPQFTYHRQVTGLTISTAF